MDGHHPKRRKDKYNPYTIGTTEDGRHWLTFSDGQGNRHHFEISAAVFELLDSFELDDLSYLNEVDRHYEQSELTEASLYDRAVHRPATVEESTLQSMEYAKLHRAISELPEIQKRRLILYYFQGLTYEQIAGIEGCTKRAVKFSLDIAVEKLKKFFKNFLIVAATWQMTKSSPIEIPYIYSTLYRYQLQGQYCELFQLIKGTV